MGDGAFFTLLREWTGTYRDRTVTTEAFEAMARRYATRPVDGLFTTWLYDQRLPALPTGAP
jgi:hypothetical protein